MTRFRKQTAAELASPCPHCGDERLTPAGPGRALCLGCRRCWEAVGNVIRWVSPVRCTGCDLRPMCFEPVRTPGEVTVLSTSARHRRRRAPEGETPDPPQHLQPIA